MTPFGTTNKQLTTSWGPKDTKTRTWSQEEITYSLPDATPNNYPTVPTEAGTNGASLVTMTATMKSRAQLAFELWDDLIDVSLTDAGSATNADMTFNYSMNTDKKGSGTYAANPHIAQTVGTDSQMESVQIWFDSTDATQDADADMGYGQVAFWSYVHEIGHALGLSHPGTYNSTNAVQPTYAANAAFPEDTKQYTAMSYFGFYQLPTAGMTAGWQQDGHVPDGWYSSTPMVLDIVAIQSKYGADYTTRSGNSVYGFNVTADVAARPVYDFTKAANPIFTIWDGGGWDKLDASGFKQNQIINLEAGSYSSIGGMINNIAVAYKHNTDSRSLLEEAIGGSGDDTILGNETGNVLRGGEGDDTLMGLFGVDLLFGGDDNDHLVGGEGDGGWMAGQQTFGDILDGGEGSDTAHYHDSWEAVTVDLRSGLADGGTAKGDQLTRVENLVGSAFSDDLKGNGETNWLQGLDGDDDLEGFGGSDILDGGRGVDTVRYITSEAAIGVNLFLGIGSGGDAQGDTLVEIENVVGSRFDDRLFGNDETNILAGFDGHDTFRGGAGNDEFWGDGGLDTADYSKSASAIWAHLTENAAGGDEREGIDRLFDIENVTGSEWSDDIRGDARDNVLNGLGGNDFFTGDAGADIIDGGNDIDRLSYLGSIDGVNVSLEEGLGRGGDAAGDHLASIENITGSLQSDFIFGNADGNELDGALGDDALEGRGGRDVLLGGIGDDHLMGEAGDDHLDGGADLDTAIFRGFKADFTLVGERTGFTVTDRVAGRDGTDTVRDVEFVQFAEGVFRVEDLLSDRIVGTVKQDSLTGDARGNILEGGAGNDLLAGKGGADILDGGGDTDTASYTTSSRAVTIELAAGTGRGGDAEGDTLISIERVVGSALADQLTGSLGDDVLEGGRGVDTLRGGAGDDSLIGNQGADVLDGGTGTDTASYETSRVGVTVNLATGAGRGGDAQGDTLMGIEQLIGSAFGDTLRGGTDRGKFLAGDGNDTMIGGSVFDWSEGGNGNDTFIGTGGYMVMIGGDGDDTMTGSLQNGNYFDGGIGNDVMVGGNSSDYMQDMQAGNDTMRGGSGNDTFIDVYGISQLFGEGGDDTMWAGGGSGLLDGGDGKDKVTAANGDYDLFGGEGEDTLEFSGLGSASYTGGSGVDVFTYRVLYGDGQFTVTDFEDGVDRIHLWENHHYGNVPLESLTIEDSTAGAVISWNGTSEMVLTGITASQLTQGDFVV